LSIEEHATKIYKIFLVVLYALFVTISQGYSFEGSQNHPMIGNSIFPLTDVAIRLREVNVAMERQKNDIATKVISAYGLENMSNEEVHFKIAFPVESNCIGCTQMPDDFKVLVNGKPIQTFNQKITERDILSRTSKEIGLEDSGKAVYPPKKIEDMKEEIILIVWEISFKPLEEKIISCSYTTEWIGDPGTEYFEYNISALYLWQGAVEKAFFKFSLPPELIENIRKKATSRWPKIKINPGNYKIRGSAVEWSLKNLKQTKIGYMSVKIDYRKPGVIGE